MASLYKFLFQFLGDPELGKLQWNGKHFIAVLLYAQDLSCAPKSEHDKFIHRLKSLENLAQEYIYWSDGQWHRRFSEIIISLMPELREFFTVPKMNGTPKNKILATFVQFLLQPLKHLLVDPASLIIIPGKIGTLSCNLKFLLAILGDTPFQCTELEDNGNILAEIESIANEAGFFLYVFFFTTELVTEAEMNLALSFLLLKFQKVEAKIKDHFITVSKLPKFMTPNTARCVSIFIVDSVLDDLIHLMHHKSDLIVEKKDQIIALHEELTFSRSFLGDKEVLQNKELLECEMRLTELAYDAEYIITWFMAGEVPVWYLALRLFNFIQMSKFIMTALQEMELNYSIKSTEDAESPREVSPLVTKSIPLVDQIVVGLEEKTTQIASQLVGGPDCLQIISIIGMGGIGKTTLAMKLYNHSSIVYHFHKRSSCVVSQTYQKRKLLIDLLSSLSNINENGISKKEEDALAGLLYKNLKGRRYFLVIDDIWSTEAWDGLKRFFPDDTNGSRILLTSRNKDVALQASSNHGFIHELSLLSVDECWDLLQQKVFQKGHCPPELQSVGTKIAKCCKGLPLAVVGIAAILATMAKKKILWEGVATNLSSYVSEHQDILELSYKHLPTHLKPCFLYLGIFDEDTKISVRHLSALWISQGFIPKEEGKSLEDVADDFLMELVSRSMVLVGERRSDNGVKTCIIHDLVRDMCIRIATEENFLKVIKEKLSMYEQQHHLRFPRYSSDLRSSRPLGLHIRSLLEESSNFCH